MTICIQLGRALALAALLLLGRPVFGQVTILSEGFEGAFPGGWSVYTEGDAGWSDVSTRAHTGNWSAYCAGDGFSPGPPYSPDTYTSLYRNIDLAGLTSATLSFWYYIPSIETGIDGCGVFIGDNNVWFLSMPTSGWQQQSINLNSYVGSVQTLSFDFVSDDSIEGEGWYVDDILVTGTGPGGQPNLTSTQPAGWSDRIVVSRTPGTTVDSADLTPDDTLYVDWAIVNNGSVATGPGFVIQLYVDDVLRNSWTQLNPVGINSTIFIDDYSIGSLTAGAHVLRLRIDSGDSVQESNELDNERTKTILVSGTPDIRIAPLSATLNVSDALTGFAAAAGEPEVALESDRPPDAKLTEAGEIFTGFQAGRDSVKVKVNLSTPPGLPRGRDWDERAKLRAWQSRIRERQDEVIAGFGAGLKLRHRFENQAGFSAEVTREALDKLARHPRVRSIEPVRIVRPMLAQGIPLMGGTAYRSTYNGSGVSVAIVDTGVDYNHPNLGGGGFPNSKVIGGFDFGDFDFNPAPWDDAHGTACAGIVAGALETVGDYIGGVAHNAKLYALKITEDGFEGADDDAIVAAWNWCVSHKNDDPANPILVISTSFGGGRYFSTCDTSQSSYLTAANNAASAGITILVSAGNEGYCNALASPSCISSVIAVGSVYDAAYGVVQGCIEAQSCVPRLPGFGCPDGYYEETTAPDKVPSYSNTASFLGVLAPANRASTTDMVGGGGYTAGDYTTSFGGTSAACPYAAGAVAALQSAARTVLGRHLSPGEVRTRLTSSGDNVTDAKAPVTTPRINLARAIETLGQSASFTIHNDGNGVLEVTSITPDFAAPWLSWFPTAPFSVGPGEAQVVAVSANSTTAPVGQTQLRLLVNSNDADESPYPGGVNLTVNRLDTRPTLEARLVGSKVVVSWTTNSAGYVLQSNGNLNTGNWGNVAATPVVVGARKHVTNDVAPGGLFFRLRK